MRSCGIHAARWCSVIVVAALLQLKGFAQADK